VHAFIPRSKRQMINGDAYSNASRRKTNLHAYVYLVLSIRQAMETLVNSSRRKTKVRVHVYLVLSVRRAMKTHIQTQAGEKQIYKCMYTSF